jgi:DNA repair exonuclease SbcCD ATPase subunit
MHLNELRADNFKRLRAVRIEFPEGGGAVEICGSNGQGKSSTIDAIWAAMGGARAAPDVPIRAGSRKAEVTLDLGDYKVVRTWDREGSRLTVTDATGSVQASPQAILDGLFNRLGFDPLEFVRLKPKDQADTLRRVVGLDFSEIDRERKSKYDARTEVNREVKRLEARLAATPEVDPVDPIDVMELTREFKAATEHNKRVDAARAAVDSAVAEVENTRAEVLRLKEEFEAAQNAMLDAECVLVDASQASHEAGNPIDTDPIVEAMGEAQETNERARQHALRSALETTLETTRETADRFKDQIDDLDAYRQRLLTEAEMPVPGLSLEEDEVTLNGVPLAQASSAERIRVGLAMAAAMKPGLRLVAIREGSLLDEASLKTVAEWAAEHGYQVLVERVAAGPTGVGVVIEDGAVTAASGVNARVRTRPTRVDVPNLFDQPHAADGGVAPE